MPTDRYHEIFGWTEEERSDVSFSAVFISILTILWLAFVAFCCTR